MKKLLIFIILFLLPFGVYAKTVKYEVSFKKCVDGDTATVLLKKKSIKLRFLAVDTPESVHPKKEVEPYGKEASEYTCNKLKNAKKIEIEYDNDSDKTDKYDRHLVWVFVDDTLLQKDLVKKGYAKVAYLYGDYKYTDELEKQEEIAKKNKIGIWSLNVESSEKNDDEKDEYDSFIDLIIDYVKKIIKEIIDYIFNLLKDML